MYSVNNALQRYDHLSRDIMVNHLNVLKEKKPTKDHSDVQYGGHTIDAMHVTLRKTGYQTRCLNTTSTLAHCSRKRWSGKIANSTFDHLIMIGKMPEAEERSEHCIVRAGVGDFFFRR